MTPAQFSQAYARVAMAHGLPALEPARCHVQTQMMSEPAQILMELRQRQLQQGWLQFQSQVTTFIAGAVPEPAPDWGVLLAAEAVDAAGRSIHLRQHGTGGWLLTVCTPADDTSAEVEDDLVLADEVTQLPTDRAPGPLRYRRYWSLDPATGSIPRFAAFIGFVLREDR
jgi:hypothetical protein